MGNYTLYLIYHHGFKPKYYCPYDSENPICILPHHVSRLYGVKIANMLCGNRSIDQMYSTTEYFDAVGSVKESVPQDASKDLIRCMHFSDDWDDTKLDSSLHSTKEGLKDGTARHRKKHAKLEDAYNKGGRPV